MNVTDIRPPKQPLRAVIYGRDGQVVLIVADLTELVVEALRRGLVKV